VTLSLMNACVGLGRTGYPLVLVKNVDAGMTMYLTASADHLCKTPIVVGKGGVRSSAV